MALFFAPILVLAPWRKERWPSLLLVSSTLIVLACLARYAIRDVRMDWVHPKMPFLGNVIEDTGLGPITLSDVYWAKLSRPKWPPWCWAIIETIALHGVALFAPILVGAARIARRPGRGLATEILAFGVLGCAGSLFLSIQAFKMETLDRYHVPSVLLLPLVLAIAVSTLRGELAPGCTASIGTPGRSLVGAAAILAPMAWFSIAGLHDYFRWNDVRWQLFREAVRDGATVATIDGGYEVNAWMHYDSIQAHDVPKGCIGPCRCIFATWYALDCSYHIGMNVLPGFKAVSSVLPSYWLASGPPMTLSRRLP
jgi:hypothetical protein